MNTFPVDGQSRRDFLAGAAWMGMAAVAGECLGADRKLAAGGSMAGFSVAPMRRVRVAMVALGSRGYWALQRLAIIPGLDITALCELDAEKIAKSQEFLAKKGKPKAKEYVGPEAYKRLAEDGVADVFYNCTPRDIHTELNVFAMKCGMHVLTEVPSGRTVDECWETVETCEKHRVHCMMLENCCYGEMEMLALNIVRKGLLGEIVQCDGAYIHDQRAGQFKGDEIGWRLKDMVEKRGNYYPTHGLGPLCKCLDINRGDAFDFLVSMNSASPSFEGMARSKPKGSAYDGLRFNRGDVNFTLIRTKRGRLISLQHNVATPRPYDRVNQIVGTKGVMRGIWGGEYQICFENGLCDGGAARYFDRDKAEAIRQEYKHPLWKSAGEIAAKIGGHGGMDFMMDIRWAYCLQNGLPLDSDVYDLAAWSSLIDLTERSVLSGSRPVSFPDFTRGAWRTAKPVDIDGIDLSKMHIA